VSTPSSRAGLLRGGFVGICSVLVTVIAHAAGGGGVPEGSTLAELIVVCATLGASIGTINPSGRRSKAALVVAALCAGQTLGHLTLTVIGGHHHTGQLLTAPMLTVHVVAALALGLLIGAVEHFYVVCSSVLSWLRLFATAVGTPSVTSTRRYSNIVVVEPVLLRAGLGMRAPPRLRRMAVQGLFP
jgi:hypothetical protein